MPAINWNKELEDLRKTKTSTQNETQSKGSKIDWEKELKGFRESNQPVETLAAETQSIPDKRTLWQTATTPISKLITGKSLSERAGLVEKTQKGISQLGTQRAMTGKPLGVTEAFIRGLPAQTGESLINFADITPTDVAVMGVTAGLAKVPFRGVPLGEVATKIPLNRRFFSNIDEFSRYQNWLKTTTPFSSRGVKAIAPTPITEPKLSTPTEGKVEGGINIFGEPSTELGNYITSKLGVKYEKIKLISEHSKNIGERRDARKILRIISDRIEEPYKLQKLAEFQPESELFKKALSPTGQSTGGKVSPEFAENINLTKYPPDVRQTISDMVIKEPELGKTLAISDKELLSRAIELKDTPTLKYLADLPEGTVESEALKLRMGNVDLIRKSLGAELTELKNTLDNTIQQGIGLHRRTASMFGRGLRQQRLPAETQQNMAFAIDNTLKRIKKDPIFSKDQELIDTVKKLRSMVVDKEFNPNMWNKVYFGWLNSILSNPWTHLVNTGSNLVFAAMKLPEKFTSALWDLPLSWKTGKRTQFFGEIPAMAKGAFSRQSLPQDLAMGSKLDIMTTPIKGRLGKVIGTPVKLLQAEDNIAKSIIGKMELAGQRYAGKTGEEITKAVNVEQLYRTFQNDTGSLAEAMMFMRSKVPGLRYIIPFIRTPANLIARGLERTPLVAAKIAHKARIGGYTQETLAKDLGNLTLGTIGTALMGYQFAKGNITGKAPAQPAERDAFYRQGKKPNAMRIGNYWVPLERLEPIGTSFSTMANLIQDYKEGKGEIPTEKFMTALSGLGKTLLNKTYLSGLTNMVNAISDPEMYGKGFLNRIVSGVEPQLLKFFADLKDPYYREANTILDQLKIKVPFVSETLPPKLNVFGEPIKKDFLNIGRVSKEPLEQMLQGMPIGFPGKTLWGEKLIPEEYRWLLQTSGRELKKKLLKINPDRFNVLPPEVKEEAIDMFRRESIKIPRKILNIIRKNRIKGQ